MPAARKLKNDLDKLPAAAPFNVVLQRDRQRLLEFLTETRDRGGIKSFRTELKQLVSNDEDVEAAQGVATEEQASTWLDQASEMLGTATEIAALPWSEFQTASAGFQRQVSSGNPIARSLFGPFWDEREVVALRWKQEKSIARLAMLDAAIALQLHGQDAFRKARDPFGGGPFEYREVAGGYTLTSRLTVGGKPFAMTFGAEAVPKMNQHSGLLVYDEDADAASDIQRALSAAQREKKRVLLLWGFNGCIPCYLLHRTFEEEESLAAILQSGFVRQPVDVTNDANDALATKYGVGLPGVPHLTILDADGAVLVNAKPSDEFYINGQLNAGLIRDFLKQWAPADPSDEEE